MGKGLRMIKFEKINWGKIKSSLIVKLRSTDLKWNNKSQKFLNDNGPRHVYISGWWNGDVLWNELERGQAGGRETR
jgi:hypothetical protein